MSKNERKEDKMKTLYFDCSSGISGNMTLGALVEILGDEQYLVEELKKLQVDGYHIEISKKIKNGITGTYVDVVLEDHHHLHEHHHEEHPHEQMHEHHHEHRNLQDVNHIIENSNLEEGTKQLAKRIFRRVAEAEAKVHHKSIEEVHFHEVGAIDSIVDIVGTAILIHKIHPDKIISSVVNDGYGFIECAHGTMFVPVPATSEIFTTAKVKCRQIDIDTELVTPTGAAIISELATEFSVMPTMTVQKIGWGAGKKDLKIPNVLKVYLGEMEEKLEEKQEIAVMETNIDDTTGEILGYTAEKLMQNGALDVFFTPIYMKKGRPAYRLSLACRKEDIEKLQTIIFRETTTIGIRYRYEQRTVLPREKVEVETKYGLVQAKQVKLGEETYIYPEYESLKKIAEEQKIPLKELYQLEDWKK